ncbi:MAG: hypothetical protein RIF41_09675, partial [Polyangiaceae bacterium]
MKTFIHLLAAGLTGLAILVPLAAQAEDPPLSDLPGREPVIRDLAPRVSRSLDPSAEPSTLSFRFATRKAGGR